MTTTSVSLCVILIEVVDEHPLLPSVLYLAPKYRAMAASGGSSDLEFGDGERNKIRGLRQVRHIEVETYAMSGIKEEWGTTTTTTTGGGSGRLEAPGSSSSVHTPRSDTDVSDSESGDTKKLVFLCGNPFVEVTKGVLHLYKENERTSLDKASAGGRSEMLLMLAVPAAVSCRDLLQFIAPFHADVEHIKILRDSVPNTYMVLIKLKTQQQADVFYQTLNGTTFNSFEEDLCNLTYVARVETMKESKGVGLPLVGHTELPTCPVCLERMDESVDGVLTILCNHSFHSLCLSKWSDARCPVCRFVQTPEPTIGNECFECQGTESLWICLICGHIGCGRYVHGHAYKHFCETSHCYAIQPDNNRVWDYAGDNFVHRLLQNKDGKLVDVGPSRPQARLDETCEEAQDKLDSIQLEFTYMLTTQLESQRYFYEEKIATQVREMNREVEKLQIRLEENDKYKEETDTKIAGLSKERANLEKKIAQVNQKLAKSITDLKEEKEVNKHMKNDHEKWVALVSKLEREHEQYVKDKTAEITDLKEQLRDVMFFIEGGKMIDASPLKDELTEGQVVVGPSAPPKKERRKKR